MDYLCILIYYRQVENFKRGVDFGRWPHNVVGIRYFNSKVVSDFLLERTGVFISFIANK